jgi:hypothetical protein
MIAQAAQTAAEKEAILKIRSNPRLWMENCSSILKQNGQEEAPQLNEFQREVNRIYLWCRKNKVPCRIIILKPRKKGSSTVSLGLCYTHLRNHIAYGAVLGDDLGTTEKLMEYWDRYARRDRFGHWGNTISKDLRKFSHGSKMIEETANDPRAGMGGDIHFLVASEAAHYRRKGKSSGETVMMSIMNSVPTNWNTCVIMESTPNGAQGVYFETWQAAVSFEDFKAGKRGNGFIRVFFPWFAFADSACYDMTPEARQRVLDTLDADSRFEGERELVQKYNVSPEKLEWRRRKILGPECGGDKKKFDQEFPRDDMSCFLQSGSGRFGAEGIASMRADLLVDAPQWRYGVLEKPPGADGVVFRETQVTEAWIRINEMPRPGCRYVGASDYMTGEQASASLRETDCHTYGVLRMAYTDPDNAGHRARVVAVNLDDDREKDIDIIVERQALLDEFYGKCPFAPEINKHGDALISLLRKAGVNVWSRKRAGGGGKTVMIPGWETNAATKRQIIGELAAVIREEQLEGLTERMINELANFITWPDGKEAAGDGWHDDWVMFLAIAIHILPAGSTYETTEQKQARDVRRMEHYARRSSGNSSLLGECT